MGASIKPGYKDLSKSPWDVPLNSGSKGFRKGDGLLVHRVARMFEQLLLLLLDSVLVIALIRYTLTRLPVLLFLI